MIVIAKKKQRYRSIGNGEIAQQTPKSKRSAADQSFFSANAQQSKTRGAQIISGKRYSWLRGQLSAKYLSIFQFGKTFDDSCVFYLADPLHDYSQIQIGEWGALSRGTAPPRTTCLVKKICSKFLFLFFPRNFFCILVFQTEFF